MITFLLALLVLPLLALNVVAVVKAASYVRMLPTVLKGFKDAFNSEKRFRDKVVELAKVSKFVAIKFVRNERGSSLKEAKDYVDNLVP